MLAHARHYANTVTVSKFIQPRQRLGGPGTCPPGRQACGLHNINYLCAAGISSNRTTLPERDSHINFDLFSGHKRQVYKCCFPLCFFHFYSCFFLNCDLNSLWDSFHQARGHIAEVVYSFLTQLEGKGPWAPHNRAVWDTLACWLYKYYYLIKWS